MHLYIKLETERHRCAREKRVNEYQAARGLPPIYGSLSIIVDDMNQEHCAVPYLGADNSHHNIEFIMETIDSILVKVPWNTKSQQQLQKIRTMYKDYCISNRVHAKIRMMLYPFGHGHTIEYLEELERYENELGIHPILKTMTISQNSR